LLAEEFGELSQAVIGQTVEAALVIEEPMGGEDVEVWVEDEVVAESVHGGSGGEATVRKIEDGAKGVPQAGGGGVEEVGEELAAFAKDAAEDLGDGEHELAVGHFVADGGGDPVAGGADTALMAGRTEVAALAGEGEEAFEAAVGAMESGEAGGEVATAEEGFDGCGSGGVERAEILAVPFFVVGEEIVPAVADKLPEGRGAGAAGLAPCWPPPAATAGSACGMPGRRPRWTATPACWTSTRAGGCRASPGRRTG
jgi:hypothetical protein